MPGYAVGKLGDHQRLCFEVEKWSKLVIKRQSAVYEAKNFLSEAREALRAFEKLHPEFAKQSSPQPQGDATPYLQAGSRPLRHHGR